MEANFFRFVVEELYPRIKGLRIQKVYMPAQDVWTFSFGASLNLLFFQAPKGGGLFLSSDKPSNPQTPSAQVMRLRKLIGNQRIVACKNLWPWRRVAFELSFTRDYLVLDICKGPFVEHQVKDPEAPMSWPDPDEISVRHDIWKTHPHITPPLRHALTLLSRDKAQSLLDDLKQGKAGGFYICRDSRGRKSPFCFFPYECAGVQSFESALEAAKAYGWPLVHEMVTDAPGQKKAAHSALDRVRRNLAKTSQDRDRLTSMLKEAEFGELIKSNLYTLDAGARMDEIWLSRINGKEIPIKLDPRRTILENMELFFKRAAKARRGLVFVQKREKELQNQIDNAQNPLSAYKITVRGKSGPDHNKSGMHSRSEVRRFRSSEGFIILRARNRQAGHKLLSREAAPHDLWFHVRDGAGAHVILKRAHELVEVPQTSLEEAANLAALASSKKNDLKAEIYCARVRDVRKIKGQEQGRVHVDKVLKSVLVKIDPAQETMLEIT